jgi:HemX protein
MGWWLESPLGLSVFCYAIGCFQVFRYLRNFDSIVDDGAFLWLRVGLVFQSIFLLGRWIALGYVPVTNLPEILTVLAFCLAAALVSGRFRAKAPLLTSLFLPFIFLLSLISISVMDKFDSPMAPILTTPRIASHVFLTLLGYSFFTLGFGVGLTYWIQEGQIKQHQMKKWALNLPALELLDRLTVYYTGWGLVFWTAGLFLGVFQALLSWDQFPISDPKIFGSLLVLGIYTAFFLCRWGFQMRGRKTMILVMAGYFLAFFTFVVVQVFLNSRHVF